jgi:hypothetical protein
MPGKLKTYLLLSLWAICSTFSARAQSERDTAFSDTARSLGVGVATPIDGEYVPEKPVIYNAARPTNADWQKVVSDKAYDYRDKLEYSEKKRKPPQLPEWYKWYVAIVEYLTSPVGKFILWTSLILIVGYIAYRIIKGQAGGLFAASDRKADLPGDAITEHNLLESDWDRLLQEALGKGEGRAAIRYAYLRLLQLLQEHGHIAYRPEKTNMDYYRELAGSPRRQAFRSITRQYEWAWYGHFLPDQAAMDSYMQTFRQLKQSITTA